jgi:uncharacterized membrane-anchored protein
MEKQKEFKAENPNKNSKRRDKMSKRKTKESINLASLVVGIILIILGLAGSAITIPTRTPIIIAPIILLIIGSILALMGGLRKW